MDIEEQIAKLTAKLDKTVTKFETAANGRGKQRKAQPEQPEAAAASASSLKDLETQEAPIFGFPAKHRMTVSKKENP